VATQQMVEIAKALSFNSEVLIMDEPTAALTESEIDELFHITRQLRDKGVGIVHISHRLEELKKITDRVTVMRDGKYINTVITKETTIDQIISMKKGEILGFAGLMGAGRTEVARAIFGADHIDSGEIYIKGEKADIKSPQDAVRYGIAYLSEDRKRYGLALGLDVETNVVLASYNKFMSFLWVNNAKTLKVAEHYVGALAIKTPSLQQQVKNLSGGNQQKVVIGKWLTADTNILIFDEPTRGIDVGAKSEIYKLLNDLVAQGKSIIMISSELPEILRMSHRVIVMCEGRITGELNVEQATQEEIMRYATQRGGIMSVVEESTSNHTEIGNA